MHNQFHSGLQQRIMRRIYILAVIRALLKRRMRRLYVFATLFAISSQYISYPNVFRNVIATGSPLQSALQSLVGAPGFKLALVSAVVTAGALLLLDIAKPEKDKYQFA